MFNLSEEASVSSASMVVSPLATRGGGQGYRGMEKDNFFPSVLFLVRGQTSGFEGWGK